MLGVLVLTQVCENATGAVFRLNRCCHFPNHFQNTVYKVDRMTTQVCQRRDVCLRDHDDVYGPVRAGVVKREHVLGFHDLFDGRLAA